MNLMGVYLLISQKDKKMYIRILENDDWVVEYDAENNQYRVSYFQDYHFVDEVWFDAYKEEKRLCVESEDE